MIIGILAAMENELQPFLATWPVSKKTLRCGNTFYYCNGCGHQLILVVCGRGKVNAAFFAQDLIYHDQPEVILNIGVAGGLAESAEIFDLYAGTAYCHYDVRKRQSLTAFPKILYYPADEELLTLIKAAAPQLRTAVFGTGEGFVADAHSKQRLRTEFGISTVDMESAAIAQVCYLTHTRFLGLRAVCDKADKQARHTSEDLQEAAVSRLVAPLQQVLKRL